MNFDEIVVKESPGLCRCCLSEGCYKDLGTEYTWMNDPEIYADMLLDCFDIGISQHNDGPNGPKRLICEVCITRLRDACNFKKQVLDSEKRFINMLGRGEFRPKMLIYQPQNKELKSEAVETEEPTEYGDLTEVEFLEDMDEEEVIKTEDISVATTSEDTDGPKPKRGRPRKEEEKPPKPGKKAKVTKDCNPERDVVPNEQKRRNLEILFNNTTIVPFKHRGKYLCFFCATEMEDRKQLVEHNATHLPCSTADHCLKIMKGNDFEIKVDVSDIKCKICSERFANKEDIAFHLATKHKLPYDINTQVFLTAYRLKDFKCLVCDKSLNYFVNLVRHMNNQHPDNCFECDHCHQVFNKKKDLQSHIRHFHKQEYKCPKCLGTFNSNSELVRHKTRDHISQCNICFKTFSSFKMRLEHMKGEHNIAEGGKCGLCAKEFSTKNGFLDHAAKCTVGDIAKVEKNVIRKENKKDDPIKVLRRSIAYLFNNTTVIPFKFFHNRFRCFYCPKEYNKCGDLRDHTAEHVCDVKQKYLKLKGLCPSKGMKIKVDSFSIQCKLCQTLFKDLEFLVSHLQIEHKADLGDFVAHLQPYKLIEDKYACPWCEQEFGHFGLTLIHVNKEHTGNRFLCTFCGRTFMNNTALRTHVSRVHEPNYRYKCSKCDVMFRGSSEYHEHMGITHGKKMINCPQCTEMFPSQYAKGLHIMKTHGGGHKCPHCDLRLTSYSRLKNHIRRLHLKEKNIECSFCGKKFFDATRLKSHMVIHVGEKSFRCDHCGKRFLRKKNLVGHINIHFKNGNMLNNTENAYS